MSRNDIREFSRALAQPVTYLGLAMLAFIYCALTYLIVADRTVAYKVAQTRGGNLVHIIDQSISNVFKSADTSLLFIRKSYQQSPSTFDLAAWVRDPSVRNELAFDFAIADANGRVVEASSSSKVIGLDISDREYFQDQRNSAADHPLISKPLMLKVAGRRGIVMSRRITNSNGIFSGIALLFIDPSELVKNADAIDLGPDGSIALVGLDGVVRARVAGGKFDDNILGKKFPPDAGVLGQAARAQSGSYWNTPGLADNISRLASYRVLKSFPLIALITISEAEVYRRANENARIYWTITLTLTAAILIGIGFGVRRERRLIAATEALARGQERYALVEAAVNDGIWDWNILTGENYMSPRWKSILGYADDELPNVEVSFFELIHPDDKVAVTEAVRAHLEANKPFSVDHRLRCKNGSYCWVNSRGQALRDAANRPVRMLGTITDITERKRSEILIEESRNNLERAETMALLGHYRFENEFK